MTKTFTNLDLLRAFDIDPTTTTGPYTPVRLISDHAMVVKTMIVPNLPIHFIIDVSLIVPGANFFFVTLDDDDVVYLKRRLGI